MRKIKNEQILSILDIEHIDSKEDITKKIENEQDTNKNKIEKVISNETTILDLEIENKK